MALLILDILRRKRKATLLDIVMEIYREIRPAYIDRIRNILERLEITGAVVRHTEVVRGPITRYVWYDTRTLRRIIVRRPGERLRTEDFSRILGIPKEDVMKVLDLAVERGWLRKITENLYEIPPKIYRVQKMKAYRTEKRTELYEVHFDKKTEVPRQLVLENFSPSEVTDFLELGVHGAVRIVVYTYRPEAWTEERLERIMRGLFAEVGITLEIFSDLPYIKTTQAYEAKEVDLDEKPKELNVDEVDVWLWVAKDDGSTYAYHFRRRAYGWTYERYIVR